MTRLSGIGTASPGDGDLLCDCPHAERPCLADAPGGGACVRKEGHSGPHVACAGKIHQAAVWDDGADDELDVDEEWKEYGTIGGGQS